MRSYQLLSIAASAATVHANLHPRDLQECYDAASDVVSIMTDLPTPDASLYSFIAEQTEWPTMTGSCDIPAITGSLADDYTSYVASFTEWVVDHKTDFSKVLAACSDVPEMASALGEYRTKLCSEYTFVTLEATTEATTSAATSTPTAKTTKKATSQATITSAAGSSARGTPFASATNTTSSLSSGSSIATETQSVNAAPQNTSMAIAAVGMAGLALAGLY